MNFQILISNFTFVVTFTGVAVASSVFTITAMSVDRYLAITQSLRQPWMPSRRGACLLLAVLWLVAFVIFAPLLVVASVEREVVPLLSRTENGSVSIVLIHYFGVGFCCFYVRKLMIWLAIAFITGLSKSNVQKSPIRWHLKCTEPCWFLSKSPLKRSWIKWNWIEITTKAWTYDRSHCFNTNLLWMDRNLFASHWLRNLTARSIVPTLIK